MAICALECLITYRAYKVGNYWFGWIETLQDKRSSYICTDSSLLIDFKAIRSEFESQGLHHLKPALLGILAFVVLVLLTLGQFCCHYNMMMRWYVEHPADGKTIARSIRVGIPPDQSVLDQKKGSPDLGHAIPEADREVKKEPMSSQRRGSIPASEVEDLESL